MPSEPPAPVRRLHLEALRACALYPQGMRHEAHPSVMPALREIGYVEERPARGRPREKRWHLTAAGRDLLRALGKDEP